MQFPSNSVAAILTARKILGTNNNQFAQEKFRLSAAAFTEYFFPSACELSNR